MKKELTRENMTAEDARAIQDIVDRIAIIIKFCSTIRDLDEFCVKPMNKMINGLNKCRNLIYDKYGI